MRLEAGQKPIEKRSSGQFNTNTLYGSAVLPRAGAVITPAEHHTIKLIYSEGLRQPTPWERFYEDAISYMANPNVTSEHLRTGEAIYEVFPHEKLRLQVSAYRTMYDDLIAQREVTKTDGSVWNQFQNTRGFVSHGLEAEAGLTLPGDGHIDLNGTLQRVISLDTHKWADNSPRVLANVVATQPLYWNVLSLATDGHMVGDRRSTETGAHAGTYWLWNGAFVYKTPVDRLETSVRVWNLFDRQYENVAFSPHWPIFKVPEPRRTVFARIDYGF